MSRFVPDKIDWDQHFARHEQYYHREIGDRLEFHKNAQSLDITSNHSQILWRPLVNLFAYSEISLNSLRFILNWEER